MSHKEWQTDENWPSVTWWSVWFMLVIRRFGSDVPKYDDDDVFEKELIVETSVVLLSDGW